MTVHSDGSRNGTGLVMMQAPRSAAAEAYRTLSTNIQFSSLDRDLKILMVTSVGPDEGKSIVLANLAITMAESGRKVVMVDCDLRHPSLHEVFGTSDQRTSSGFPNPLHQRRPSARNSATTLFRSAIAP